MIDNEGVNGERGEESSVTFCLRYRYLGRCLVPSSLIGLNYRSGYWLIWYVNGVERMVEI